MCVAIPAKIIGIDPGANEALVDVDGVRRKASLTLVEDARVGDYVILHAGFAINVIGEADAVQSLALLNEMMAENSSGEP